MKKCILLISRICPSQFRVKMPHLAHSRQNCKFHVMRELRVWVAALSNLSVWRWEAADTSPDCWRCENALAGGNWWTNGFEKQSAFRFLRQDSPESLPVVTEALETALSSGWNWQKGLPSTRNAPAALTCKPLYMCIRPGSVQRVWNQYNLCWVLPRWL